MTDQARIDVDVVIVGAGLAGLSAACRIVETGDQVAVLEARDRVGGRIIDAEVGGATFELGAISITSRMTRITALAEELGLDTYEWVFHGAGLAMIDGEVREDPGFEAGLSDEAREDYIRVNKRLEELIPQVDPANPWESPGASQLDHMTLAAWLEANTSHEIVRSHLSAIAEGHYGAGPEELSMLGYLYKISSAGGLKNYLSPAAYYRLVDGAHAVPRGLAAKLGDSVHLSQPVAWITQDGSGVEVFARTLRVRAQRCIVAVPPVLIGRIGFTPPLPGDYAQLLQRLPMGALVSTHVIYSQPFWRDRGLSGAVRGTDDDVFSYTYDSSPSSGAVGALCVRTGGSKARQLGRLDRSARQQAMIESISKYLGEDAREAEDYVDLVWADEEWTRGAYSSIFSPGALSALGSQLRQPFGRVHWASTETAATLYGAMDGALESAERAVSELNSPS